MTRGRSLRFGKGVKTGGTAAFVERFGQDPSSEQAKSALSLNLRIDLNQNIEKALAFRLGSIGASGITVGRLAGDHAAFGGYKQFGVGREAHKMMLDHYQETKNMLVSYSPKKLGFF